MLVGSLGILWLSTGSNPSRLLLLSFVGKFVWLAAFLDRGVV